MTTFDAEQELAFIRTVIEDTKRKLVYDGMEYIIWGILVVAGMLGTYASLEMKAYDKIAWIWVVCIGLGWAYSLVRGYRMDKAQRVKTVAGRIIASVWLGTGITMTLLGFVGTATGIVKGFAVAPLAAIVLGIPYLASGVIIDSKFIRNLAFGWWLGGVVMMIWPGRYMFLLFALMIVALQIVPGFVFRRRWKQEHGEKS